MERGLCLGALQLAPKRVDTRNESTERIVGKAQAHAIVEIVFRSSAATVARSADPVARFKCGFSG